MEKRQRSDWDEGGGDPLAVFTCLVVVFTCLRGDPLAVFTPLRGDPLAVFTCLRGDPLAVFTPPVATPEAIWTHTREEFHS